MLYYPVIDASSICLVRIVNKTTANLLKKQTLSNTFVHACTPLIAYKRLNYCHVRRCGLSFEYDEGPRRAKRG